MRSVASLFTICGIFAILLSVTTACSSSRRVNQDDENDSGSRSDPDGGTSRESDGGEELDKDPSSEKITAGSSGSADSTGGDGRSKEDNPVLVRCDSDGYCYWSDGHCESEAIDAGAPIDVVPTGGVIEVGPIAGSSGGAVPVPPFFTGPAGGRVIDPDDFTKEPWDPPIDDLAEPRWRNSGDPLCTEMQNDIMSHSVWSDSRGVYVLASGSGNGEYHYELDESVMPPGFPVTSSSLIPPFGSCVGEGCPRIEIYFNDGNGWESVFREDLMAPFFGPGETQITGFDNGPLLMFGYQDIFSIISSSSACGLATIENGDKTCEPISYVEDVFVVNNSSAYASYEGDLIRYNGSSWGPLPGALSDNSINVIWANETHLYGTMNGAGRIVELHNGAWELLDTGTLEEFTALWGFGESDLWAGTDNGSVFHCEEGTCGEISWQGDDCAYDSEVGQIWGSNGTVYFYTPSSIARIVDSEVEVLASLPCPEDQEVPRITSLWGNGPNEVFFTIVDESFPRRECGVTYVVWFDGKEFHRF